MLVPIRRLLQQPKFVQACPKILSPTADLETLVRGIHIAESADLAGLLEGHELILCSGLTLSESPADCEIFLQRLAEAGASGVIFSFLADAPQIKSALESAAAKRSFPVILLRDRVRFIDIVEAVNETLQANSLLWAADRVSEFMNSSTIEDLDSSGILNHTAEILQLPLVLDDPLGRLVFQQGLDSALLSGLVRTRSSTADVASAGFEVAGQRWLRVPILAGRHRLGFLSCPAGQDTPVISAALERVAAVVGSRIQHDPAVLGLLRQDQAAQCFAALASDPISNSSFTDQHLELMGIKLTGQVLPAALSAEAQDMRGGGTQVLERLRRRISTLSLPIFVFPARAISTDSGEGQPVQDGGETGDLAALIFLRPHETAESAGKIFFEHVAKTVNLDKWAMGVAETRSSLGEAIEGGIKEARRVARGALSLPGRTARIYHSKDLGFRWVIQALRETGVAGEFVHDQLADLPAEPALLDFLEAFLETNGNIAQLSRRIHLSRPSIYARLNRLTDVYGYDLERADTRTSLHVAIALHRMSPEQSSAARESDPPPNHSR